MAKKNPPKNYTPIKNSNMINAGETKTLKQQAAKPSENFKRPDEKFVDLTQRQPVHKSMSYQERIGKRIAEFEKSQKTEQVKEKAPSKEITKDR